MAPHDPRRAELERVHVATTALHARLTTGVAAMLREAGSVRRTARSDA
ncbi:hypothetical protein IGS67_11185 [Flavimobilis sp. GY10621]|uniref:Uncharacterized protein n=1 Tax=Flavimobilis rhizosphaerae TaxID=2775421 RepID=A0ABR9DSR2_9MICO|nr:hypothetical protein [Flavimobilis rhizosphaerae]MBD9700048.1 hypothetical protein [Flavimobilis rhizosphaerae]